MAAANPAGRRPFQQYNNQGHVHDQGSELLKRVTLVALSAIAFSALPLGINYMVSGSLLLYALLSSQRDRVNLNQPHDGYIDLHRLFARFQKSSTRGRGSNFGPHHRGGHTPGARHPVGHTSLGTSEQQRGATQNPTPQSGARHFVGGFRSTASPNTQGLGGAQTHTVGSRHPVGDTGQRTSQQQRVTLQNPSPQPEPKHPAGGFGPNATRAIGPRHAAGHGVTQRGGNQTNLPHGRSPLSRVRHPVGGGLRDQGPSGNGASGAPKTGKRHSVGKK